MNPSFDEIPFQIPVPMSTSLEYEPDPIDETTSPQIAVFVKLSDGVLETEITRLTQLLLDACDKLNEVAPSVLNSPHSQMISDLRFHKLRSWWREISIINANELKIERAKVLSKLTLDEQRLLFGEIPKKGAVGTVLDELGITKK